MNPSSMPYLTNLKATLGNLSQIFAPEQGGALQQIGIASRLLDHMMVQASLQPALRAECYAAAKKLLPAIEDALGRRDELSSLVSAANPEAFERYLQLAGDVQRELVDLGTPEALALCKSLVMIEAGYNRQFAEGVAARAAAVENRNTTTARNAREYDEKKLLAFIRQSFPEESAVEITECGLVSGGFSKFTLGIGLANTRSLPKKIVLRGDASAAFGGASVVDEYGLIRAAHEHGVRVPRPLALEDTGSVIGSPFMLTERRPSTVIGHQFGPPKPNKAICVDIATQLAKVHLVPIDALGPRINGADCTSSEKVMEWIDKGYATWKPLNMPSAIFETAFEWLRRHAHINDKGPRGLVHGDFVLNNILTHEDRVTAILDWEFAHIGNPAYDLGYSYFMASSLAPWEEYLDAYGRAGAVVPDEEQINYHILLAATRLGVMICQVAGSFVSGADTGVAGAAVVGDNYYEQMIARISFGLDRVL